LARGETTIQSDLYSLGLVLYEAFGVLPTSLDRERGKPCDGQARNRY